MSAVTLPICEVSENWSPIRALLEEAIADGVSPGVVLLAAKRGQVRIFEAAGRRTSQVSEEITASMIAKETVFDIGSLTFPVVTAYLTKQLIESGTLKLTDSVSRYLQGFSVLGKSKITIGHLLAQNSGLVEAHPFYEDLTREHSGARRGILASRGAKDYVFNWINRSGLQFEPGTKQAPSDLNGIVLGGIIEALTGLSLDRAAQKMIFQPLEMRSTGFIDLNLIRRGGVQPVTDMIAPTEECTWRKRVLCGEVHDENAWAMGGIAGHAGLFASAEDLHKFAAHLLGQKNEWASLGWESANAENELEQVGFSSRAFGCCSFTGCSLWIDPEKEIDIVLMTNRVHPSRANKKIRSFRPQLFQSVVAAL